VGVAPANAAVAGKQRKLSERAWSALDRDNLVLSRRRDRIRHDREPHQPERRVSSLIESDHLEISSLAPQRSRPTPILRSV